MRSKAHQTSARCGGWRPGVARATGGCGRAALCLGGRRGRTAGIEGDEGGGVGPALGAEVPGRSFRGQAVEGWGGGQERWGKVLKQGVGWEDLVQWSGMPNE